MTEREAWSRLLPIIDTDIAVDLHQHFAIDLDDPDTDYWHTRSWHWLRDRIRRLGDIPGTATRKAVTTDVRGRATGSADHPRGRASVRS